MQISVQQLLNQRGVWLLATRNGLKVRDGKTHKDPMVELSRSEPTWLAQRSAAEFIADKDVFVVTGLPPPEAKAEDDKAKGAKAEDEKVGEGLASSKADARAKLEAEIGNKGKGKAV
jgi:hypothetical protein